MNGHEIYNIEGLSNKLKPKQTVTVKALSKDGEKKFKMVTRIDTPVEVEYYRNGGILHMVLRQFLKK